MRTEATKKVACENAVRILFFDERQTHVQVKFFLNRHEGRFLLKNLTCVSGHSPFFRKCG